MSEAARPASEIAKQMAQPAHAHTHAGGEDAADSKGVAVNVVRIFNPLSLVRQALTVRRRIANPSYVGALAWRQLSHVAHLGFRLAPCLIPDSTFILRQSQRSRRAEEAGFCLRRRARRWARGAVRQGRAGTPKGRECGAAQLWAIQKFYLPSRGQHPTNARCMCLIDPNTIHAQSGPVRRSELVRPASPQNR